jgi:thioredoxin-dependent peroxiredoxin
MKSLLSILPVLCALTVSAVGAETPKVGDTAPTFEAKDQDGNVWKSADHVGKEAVIVYFYPKDDSPGCTKEATGFHARLDDLKQAGVAIVGVSRDSAESHKGFWDKNNLGFPLLVDTDGKLTETFGAGVPDRPRARRVSFLIGRDGKIVHVTDNRDAAVHLAELKDAVAKLKS